MREIKFRAWDAPSDGNGPSGMSYGVRHDCDATAIMQFTGLRDKNGKEIYEGDIIEYPLEDYERNVRIEVKWCDEAACFGMPTDKVEVIGNIYENPELLK
jgi:hypothetical protein